MPGGTQPGEGVCCLLLIQYEGGMLGAASGPWHWHKLQPMHNTNSMLLMHAMLASIVYSKNSTHAS